MLYFIKTWGDDSEQVLGVFDDINKIEKYIKKYLNRFGDKKTIETVKEGYYKISQYNDGEPYHFWIEPIKINKGLM